MDGQTHRHKLYIVQIRLPLTIDTCKLHGYDLVETLILDHLLWCTPSYTTLDQ